MPASTAAPSYLYALFAAVIIGRFLVRELKERRFALSRLFVVPGVLGAFAAFLLYLSFTRSAATITLLGGETLVTLGLGCAVGLAVGHFTTVRLGDRPGFVYVRGSWQTVAIWVGALLLRFLARYFFIHDDVAVQSANNAALLVMLAAALAMLRYRILIDARVLLAAGTTAPVTVV